MGDDVHTDAARSSHSCRVVAGSDAVRVVRSEDAAVPLVALVDESSPDESVLARAAGADVVLAVARPEDSDDRPGVGLATHVAELLARRRTAVATTSRRVGHDISESLNLISLTADAGRHGRLDPATAFDQIHELVQAAGHDAWRAGRASRSSALALSHVDLRAAVADEPFGPDVEIVIPERPLIVIADERRLTASITELVANARRARAGRIRVEATATSDGAAVIVDDDGTGVPSTCRDTIGQPFNTDGPSDRLGLGLAVVAEHMEDVGGRIRLVPSGDSDTTRFALEFPMFAPLDPPGAPIPEAADQAAAQAGILEGVVRHAPLSESLEAIVSAIEQQITGAMCSILLLHGDNCLRHGAGATLPAAYRDAIDGVSIGVGQGSCGTAAFTGRPVVARDVTTDENWVDFRDIALEHSLRSCWSTPIVAAEGGETLGTFAVYKSTTWHPDAASVRLVNRFTYLAAVAIEHHRLFGALEDSEARFRRAFEGAAAGIALVDVDGSFQMVNPALSGVVGRPAEQLIGTNLVDLISPEHRDAVVASWTAVTNGDDHDAPVRAVDVRQSGPADAAEKWLSLRTSLIPAESDRQRSLYVEVSDVTAKRRQQADLRAREAAEAANRAKTDFLALASHELRTPLNAILGFAQVMQLVDLDDDERTRSVDQIVHAGRHLRDLIAELLDLSKVEAGQLSVEAEPVDTDQVINEAVELVRPLAAAREITLAITPTDPTPQAIADHRCLRQVLINLIDNAVKYTPRGGRVDVTGAAPRDAVVRVAVTDSGPGISPTALDDVFQPFHRLPGAHEEEREGTGLGLALCERLMREMGGSISVASRVGAGSTFTVDLPAATGLTPTSTRPGPSGAHQHPISGATTGSVLHVEDDPACTEMVRAALSLRPDVSVRAVSTVGTALAALERDPFDLVLLDIGLPDGSGWEVLASIRSTRPGLPVIVLTAGSDTVPIDVPPPDELLSKPLDVVDVLRAVDLACGDPTGSDVLAQAVHALDQ